MSSVTPELKYYLLQSEIGELRRGGSSDEPSPHKLILLLAIIDLLDEGVIQDNRIDFDDDYIAAFQRNFIHYSSAKNWNQPGVPYFHLRSSSFWKHQVKQGQEEAYAKLTTSGGGQRRIRDNIDYAYFSPEAWPVFNDPVMRGKLRVFIAKLLDKESFV